MSVLRVSFEWLYVYLMQRTVQQVAAGERLVVRVHYLVGARVALVNALVDPPFGRLARLQQRRVEASSLVQYTLQICILKLVRY